MNKHEIPYIFKYLLRWVPGLNINFEESGDNPPVPKFILEKGDTSFGINYKFFTDLMEAHPEWQDLDMEHLMAVMTEACFDSYVFDISKLEGWDTAEYDESLCGYTLNAVDRLLDSSEDATIFKTLFTFIKYPAGVPVRQGSYEYTPTVDAYGLAGGWYGDKEFCNVERVMTSGMGSDIVPEGCQGFIYSLYLFMYGVMMSYLFERDYPDGFLLGEVHEFNKWKEFMSPLPYVRTKISPTVKQTSFSDSGTTVTEEAKSLKRLFVNTDIEPDLASLNWTVDGELVIENNSLISKIIIADSDTRNGIIVNKMPAGTRLGNYVSTADAYSIDLVKSQVTSMIYADSIYVENLVNAFGEEVVKNMEIPRGWNKLVVNPDIFWGSDHYFYINKFSGDDQDNWMLWLSNEPFEANIKSRVEITSAFEPSQTLKSTDLIAVNRANTDNLEDYLTSLTYTEIEYSHCASSDSTDYVGECDLMTTDSHVRVFARKYHNAAVDEKPEQTIYLLGFTYSDSSSRSIYDEDSILYSTQEAYVAPIPIGSTVKHILKGWQQGTEYTTNMKYFNTSKINLNITDSSISRTINIQSVNDTTPPNWNGIIFGK